MKTPLLVDIETDGRIPQRGELLLVGACVIGEPAEVYEPDDPGLGIVRDLLADPERPVVSMTKYDARYLRLQGWEVTGPYHDIQVMAWVLNENQPLSLDAIARRYCGIKMDKRLRRSKGVVYFKASDGHEYPLTDFTPRENISKAVWEEFVDYCRRDVEAEADVYQTLLEKLADSTWDEYWEEEEVPFTETLLGMECAGMPINLADSEVLRAELEDLTSLLRPELLEAGGLPATFNLNSGDQLSAYLYYPVMELADSLRWEKEEVEALKSCLDGSHEDCGDFADEHPMHIADLLPDRFSVTSVGREQVHGVWTVRGRGIPPTQKTDSEKRWSTSTPVLKSNLAAAQDPWVQKLMVYRQNEKALTTYLRKYPELAVRESGHSDVVRIYGRFNQTGTKTGRLSSSEPNMQNQPAHGELGRRMRSLFQGRLVVGDYSQLEPRLMAHFSEDPRLLAVYREDKDVYLDLAHAIFGEHVTKEDRERGIAKVLVLALGYGAGHKKVAQILTINGFPTDEFTADGYLKELQRYYHRFFAWREHVIRRVKVQGYVETLAGRHRRLRAAFADRKNWKNVGYGERQAVNAIIQGSAGDIVRRVMVLGNWQHEQRLLAQVHDELVWEWDGVGYDPSPQQLTYIQEVGETAHGFDLRCPLKFEPHFGDSWYSAKEGAPLLLPEDLELEETADFAEELSA